MNWVSILTAVECGPNPYIKEYLTKMCPKMFVWALHLFPSLINPDLVFSFTISVGDNSNSLSAFLLDKLLNITRNLMKLFLLYQTLFSIFFATFCVSNSTHLILLTLINALSLSNNVCKI